MAKSSSKRAARTSAGKKSAKWMSYNLLVASTLIINAFGVIINAAALTAYQYQLTDATVGVRNAIAVALAFGIFAFLWGLIVVSLITRMRSLRVLSVLLGLTALVSLVAAIAYGWYPTPLDVAAAYPSLPAYRGAVITLYSVQIALYFVLALHVSAYA